MKSLYTSRDRTDSSVFRCLIRVRRLSMTTRHASYKIPVPCMKNKRVVNMSGVKKDQGGVEDEKSTSKKPGPRISESDWQPTWSTALSSDHEVSHQNTSECVGPFFLGRLTNTLKFSVEFNKKKIKNKGSLRQRADPLPSTPLTISLCLSYTCSRCLFKKVRRVFYFFLLQNLLMSEKEFPKKEGIWFLATNSLDTLTVTAVHVVNFES